MSAHAYIVRDYVVSDYPESECWFPDREAAYTHARSLVRQHHDIEVTALATDGKLEADWLQWQPKPYAGPLTRARIDWCGPQRSQPAVIVHRAPIDCIKPTPSFAWALNEEHRYRVLATSTGGVEGTGDAYFNCICGDWQDIEGPPDVVAEMVAKFPYTP